MAKHALTGEVIGKPGADRRELAASAKAAAKEHAQLAKEQKEKGDAFRELLRSNVAQALIQVGYKQLPSSIVRSVMDTFADRDPDIRSCFKAAAEHHDQASKLRWQARKHNIIATIQTCAAKIGL